MTTEEPPSTSSSSGPVTRNPNAANRKPLVKPDHTILKPPIQTTITGLKQAIHALENSTPEIRDYMIHECNLIYECKACLNMFRSLANFIAHKRTFCRTKHRFLRHLPRGEGDVSPDLPSSISTVIVQAEEPIDTIVPTTDFDLMDYYPSLELMKDLGIIKEIESKPLSSSILSGAPSKKSLEKIVHDLKSKVDDSFDADYYRSKQVHLESMRYSSQGVFQTQTMGDKYLDLERARMERTAMVDPFNSVMEPGMPSRNFTQKMEEISPNPKRGFVYPCPVCSKSFSRVPTCLRHLIRAHKYSEQKANKMRPIIHKSKIFKQYSPAKKLTAEMCKDINTRTWYVPLERLTEDEIDRWTNGKSGNPLKVARDVKVSCVKLSDDAIRQTIDGIKDRIPCKPSIVGSKNQSVISSCQSSTEKPTSSGDVVIRNLSSDEDSLQSDEVSDKDVAVVPDENVVLNNNADNDEEVDVKEGISLLNESMSIVCDEEVTLNLPRNGESSNGNPTSPSSLSEKSSSLNVSPESAPLKIRNRKQASTNVAKIVAVTQKVNGDVRGEKRSAESDENSLDSVKNEESPLPPPQQLSVGGNSRTGATKRRRLNSATSTTSTRSTSSRDPSPRRKESTPGPNENGIREKSGRQEARRNSQKAA